jgi:hypothetical protein
MRDFGIWLESNGRSPAEMVLKSRLRDRWASRNNGRPMLTFAATNHSVLS